MPVLKLTQHFVTHEALCPEGKSRIEFCDSELPGLYVLASAAGEIASYYLRYKDTNGKTCHQKLGRTSAIDLVDARKKAKSLKAEIAANNFDPRAAAKAQRDVLSFREFFTQHYEPYSKPRKRSFPSDLALFNGRLRVFWDKKLNQITRQQIQSFHTSLLDEKLAPATCNHHIKLLRHAFNLAVDWDMLEQNPAARVPMFTEDNKVEHYLDDEQLERLLTALRESPARNVANIALFLLSTGARLNEALQATWNQIDRGNQLWRIPARNSKSKRVRSVPLNETALAILEQLGTEGKHEHLFINAQTNKPITSIQRVWNRLRGKAGLPHLRIHDLRHQYASFLVNSGRTLYEVQQILGHSDPKVTTRYAHLSVKSLHAAANSASVIIKAASPVPAAEVAA